MGNKYFNFRLFLLKMQKKRSNDMTTHALKLIKCTAVFVKRQEVPKTGLVKVSS